MPRTYYVEPYISARCKASQRLQYDHLDRSVTCASSPASMIGFTTPQYAFYKTYEEGERRLFHGAVEEVADWLPRILIVLGLVVGAVMFFVGRASCTTTLTKGQLPAPTRSCSIVLVHANGCVHCKNAMRPFEGVARAHRGRADFYTCEASVLPVAWSKYVSGFPTYLCFDGAGSLKTSTTGAMSSDQLEVFLRACLAAA